MCPARGSRRVDRTIFINPNRNDGTSQIPFLWRRLILNFDKSPSFEFEVKRDSVETSPSHRVIHKPSHRFYNVVQLSTEMRITPALLA